MLGGKLALNTGFTNKVCNRKCHTEEKLYVHALSFSYKLAVGALALSTSSVAFVGLYMVKSAVGIDLFAGPSFMHDTFYVYG